MDPPQGARKRLTQRHWAVMGYWANDEKKTSEVCGSNMIYTYIYIVDISYMGLLSHIKYQDDNLIFDYIIGVIIF